MDGFDFHQFLNTFDFDALSAIFTEGTWKLILQNKAVWAGGALLLVLIGIPKTRDFGSTLAGWGLVGGVYFVCGVAIKNSVISKPGPFVLLMTLTLGAIGYIIWTKLLHN